MYFMALDLPHVLILAVGVSKDILSVYEKFPPSCPHSLQSNVMELMGLC